MSHVTTVDMEIKGLDDLALACKRQGLELVIGQRTYKWYNRHVGDYPVPEGFKVEDLGKCEHAIRVPGNDTAYEIGVVRRRDGKPGYQLIYDFFGTHGRAVEKLAGSKCATLKQAYAVTVARRQAQRQGFRVQEHVGTDGQVRLTCSR